MHWQTIDLVAHDASGFPVIDWTLDNPDRVTGIVFLNTIYTASVALISVEAIARILELDLTREISVTPAKHMNLVWQSSHLEQVGKLFCEEDVRETCLKIFSYQAFEIKNVIFSFNEVFVDEVRDRTRCLPKTGNFQPPVTISFGAEDPYLSSV